MPRRRTDLVFRPRPRGPAARPPPRIPGLRLDLPTPGARDGTHERRGGQDVLLHGSGLRE